MPQRCFSEGRWLCSYVTSSSEFRRRRSVQNGCRLKFQACVNKPYYWLMYFNRISYHRGQSKTCWNVSRIITIYWNEYYRLDEKIDLMYFLKGVEICHLLISYLTWYSKNAHQTKRATHTVTLKLKRDRVEEKIESARERERERDQKERSETYILIERELNYETKAK